jgi:hypothetical protein
MLLNARSTVNIQSVVRELTKFLDPPLVGRALFHFAVARLGLPAYDMETARRSASGACARNPQKRAFPVQCRRSFRPYGQTFIAFAVPHIDNVRQPGLGAQRVLTLAPPPLPGGDRLKTSCLADSLIGHTRRFDRSTAFLRSRGLRQTRTAPQPSALAPTSDAAPQRLPMNLARPNERVQWL